MLENGAEAKEQARPQQVGQDRAAEERQRQSVALEQSRRCHGVEPAFRPRRQVGREEKERRAAQREDREQPAAESRHAREGTKQRGHGTRGGYRPWAQYV